MTYTPGAIGDPAYKACEGKTWKIAPVNATMKSIQGSFSVKTDPGTMTIIKIHESMTVPAGTFDTVHYMKTMNSGRGTTGGRVLEVDRTRRHGQAQQPPAGRDRRRNAHRDQVAGAIGGTTFSDSQ